MDWPAIGAWAGDKGPYLAIIVGQWAIIWRLLARFFDQQTIMFDQAQTNSRALELAEEKKVSA
jgi:hypothetical protein